MKIFNFLFFITSVFTCSKAGTPVSPKLYSGFSRAIEGQTIDYHCFIPRAAEALLTRTTNGEMGISWRTAPVPETHRGAATFVWIGAYSTGTSQSDRDFMLSIDKNPLLVFHTRAGGIHENWTIPEKNGITLAFEYIWTDRHRDAFGFFELTVPGHLLTPGRELEIGICGEKAESRDWYMTFAYDLKEEVDIRPIPALIRSKEGYRRLLLVGIQRLSKGGEAEVRLSGSNWIAHSLKRGYNEIEFSIPANTEKKPIHLEYRIDKGPVQKQSFLLNPVTQREIYLLPHSHNDIGYTKTQDKVLAMQKQNLRDALELIRHTTNYPERCRFKWNTEILWAVESFLEEAEPELKAEFLAAVRSGSMGLQALYVNPLTGICRPEELLRLTEYAAKLRGEFQLPLTTAMITDIPGFSWGIVPALAHAGIRYFSNGPNTGDRIGHSSRAWADRPFWWVSPSGNEKILLWTTGTGYSFFHGMASVTQDPYFERRFFKYLEELEQKKYPYEIVQMRYTVGTDNGPVDPALPDFVRNWNEKYASPLIRIATAGEMFAAFDEKYGEEIPAFAGDFSPYWEDGAASTALELGKVKRAAEKMIQAETLQALLGSTDSEPSFNHSVWRNLHLFNEHTWGAWNSISEPDLPEVKRQWEIKKKFADDASAGAHSFLDMLLHSHAEQNSWIEVINTNSWNRSDLVSVPMGFNRSGNRMLDEQGKPVPSQLLSDGSLVFIAENVPALGSRKYRIAPGVEEAPERPLIVETNRLADGYVDLRIDPETGNISSLRTGPRFSEMVQEESPGLNQYLYVPGTDPAVFQTDGNVRIRILENGPLLGSIRVESTPPGSRALWREITLVKGLNRVDIRDLLDKIPVREKESVRFAFPFAVTEPVVRLDQGWGIMRPGIDQLPGANRDFFCAQRWADVSNQEVGITLALVEAPLVETGTMCVETFHNHGPKGWKTSASPSSRLFSYVMNNYWHTNYRADQEGKTEFHYALRGHGLFDSAAAYRFGVEVNQPMLVRMVPPDTSALESFLRLTPGSVVVSAMKPLNDGSGILVRLYNAGGKPEDVQLKWRRFHPRNVYFSDTAEKKRAVAGDSISMLPFAMVTLRCERKSPLERE